MVNCVLEHQGDGKRLGMPHSVHMRRWNGGGKSSEASIVVSANNADAETLGLLTLGVNERCIHIPSQGLNGGWAVPGDPSIFAAFRDGYARSSDSTGFSYTSALASNVTFLLLLVGGGV